MSLSSALALADRDRTTSEAGSSGVTHEDGSLRQMFSDSLRGPRGWMVKVALAKGLVFYAFGVYCAVCAILTDDVRSVVLWSLGALWSIAVVVSVKLWWWNEMNRRSILRGLRREAAAYARWESRRSIPRRAGGDVELTGGGAP